MRTTLLTFGFFVFLLAPALAEQRALPRWALMATDDVADCGLLDLLTVELSRDDSLQLVERAHLQMVMRELELSALVKPGRVSDRLQLGKTLKANALMVLSFDGAADKRRLDVVVCDADRGIRLWQGTFAYHGEADVEKLVRECAATVDEVRQRFAVGVRHVVAVPPFLSEDFEQRFDYLQTRYRDLLSSALVARAGVAVVEIEEARAILRELESTLSGGLERPIATLVKASYRVGPPNENNPRQVHLKIELAHGNDRREQIEKTLQLDTVDAWLVDNLASQLVSASDRPAPALSPELQMQILSRHAQRFAELGNWEQSTSLREAALVVDPNDALQRALAISEYQHAIRHAVKENWHKARFAKPLAAEPRGRALRRAAHDYRVGLEHLGYLIRNRLIGRVDAIGMLGKHGWREPQFELAAALPHDPLLFDALQPAWSAQRAFLRDVYPLVSQLPAGRRLPQRLSDPYYAGRYVVACHVASDVGFNDYSPESLASLRDVLTRIFPPDEKTTQRMLHVFSRTYLPKQGHASYAEWRQLVAELSRSDRELARLYGQFALAVEAKKRDESKAALEQLLAEVTRLGRTGEPIFKDTNIRLMRFKGPSPLTPAAPAPRGDFGPLGRMHLEPIPLVVQGERNARPPRIIGMVRCGDRDAYWSQDRFFVMHQKGVLRELKLTDATAEHALFWEVAWDGECIWLHAYGQGIIVVRPDGTRVASFKGKTPGYWKGHKLLGLSPRRALMVGSFGDTKRAWCGLLEVDEDGETSANIFFEAKNVSEGRPPEQASADVRTVFQPVDLSRVRHADGKQYALVDRDVLAPLRIDLETLEVSVAEKGLDAGAATTQTDLGFSGTRFLRDGRPIWAHSGLASSPSSKWLVYHDGWLYRPGYVWMRQHAEMRKLERLQASQLAHAYWHLRAGSSAHYGLITFDPDGTPPLSQVTILDEQLAESNK